MNEGQCIVKGCTFDADEDGVELEMRLPVFVKGSPLITPSGAHVPIGEFTISGPGLCEDHGRDARVGRRLELEEGAWDL